MAGYTAAHIDICFSPETISFGNRAMTGLTGCSAIQMYLVAEVHECGKFVYPDPRDGPVGFCILSQIFNIGAVCLDCLMAGHATLRLGYGLNLA